jgi:hypothetical protein
VGHRDSLRLGIKSADIRKRGTRKLIRRELNGLGCLSAPLCEFEVLSSLLLGTSTTKFAQNFFAVVWSLNSRTGFTMSGISSYIMIFYIENIEWFYKEFGFRVR